MVGRDIIQSYRRVVSRPILVNLILVVGLLAPIAGDWVFKNLKVRGLREAASSACKVIEPRMQLGATREALEFLTALFQNFDGAEIRIVIFDGDQKLASMPEISGSSPLFTCQPRGRSNAEIRFEVRPESLDLISYLVLFFLTVLCMSGSLIIGDRLILMVQAHVARTFEDLLVRRLKLGTAENTEASFAGKLSAWWININDSAIVERINLRIDRLEGKIQEQAMALARQEGLRRTAQLALQVGHDIRSPLSALKIGLSKLDSENSAVQIMKSAIGRIEVIATDLLQTRKQTENLNASKAVSILDALKKEINPDDKSVVEISGSSPDRATTITKSVFERVCSNLIINGIEAGGKVVVSISSGHDQLILHVRDTGKGMSQELINQIYSGTSVTTKEKGNGLGLLNAIDELRKIGGDLTVNSEMGKGTCIELRIPFS